MAVEKGWRYVALSPDLLGLRLGRTVGSNWHEAVSFVGVEPPDANVVIAARGVDAQDVVLVDRDYTGANMFDWAREARRARVAQVCGLLGDLFESFDDVGPMPDGRLARNRVSLRAVIYCFDGRADERVRGAPVDG